MWAIFTALEGKEAPGTYMEVVAKKANKKGVPHQFPLHYNDTLIRTCIYSLLCKRKASELRILLSLFFSGCWSLCLVKLFFFFILSVCIAFCCVNMGREGRFNKLSFPNSRGASSDVAARSVRRGFASEPREPCPTSRQVARHVLVRCGPVRTVPYGPGGGGGY